MNKRNWDIGRGNTELEIPPITRSISEFSAEIKISHYTLKHRIKKSGVMLRIHLSVRGKNYHEQADLIAWHNQYLIDWPNARGVQI